MCGINEIFYNLVNGFCCCCLVCYWMNKNYIVCLFIIFIVVRFSDLVGILVGVVVMLGVLGVFFVMVVYCCYSNIYIVWVLSKVLSYIMLFGIFFGYLMVVLILLERIEILCKIVFFFFSIGFCIVVGILLIKINWIYWIFSKRVMRKGMLYILMNY